MYNVCAFGADTHLQLTTSVSGIARACSVGMHEILLLGTCVQASEVPSHLDEAGAVPHGDFRRGTRMRKLLRRLNATAAQATIKRFRLHAIFLVVSLLAVHIACFAIVYTTISKQMDEVMDLNKVGEWCVHI